MSYPEEKLTRFCLLPWRFMQIHAGGMMQCCAVGPDTDLGDFLLDYCEKDDKSKDPFDNEGLQLIRKGLMTGNLRPMCRNCFFVPNERITTSEFERRLKAFLESRNRGIDVENEDLSRVHAYNWMAISFTNRCNLSCVYCVQSTQKDINPFFKMEFPYEYARQTLDLFAEQGIDKLSTCVEGEGTLYPHWYELISEFHKNNPNVILAMTTNLNRKYNDDEIDLLAEYTELDVSIDSVDSAIYKELRRNGRLELLLENVDKVQKRVRELQIKGPRITFHTVLSDKSWQSLVGLYEYAFERGIGINVGNYERRSNTLAEREGLIKPISELPYDVQIEIYEVFKNMQQAAIEKRCFLQFQGDIFTKLKNQVEVNYNEFEPYDDRILLIRFAEQSPKGEVNLHLAYAYDTDNISHEGIMVGRGREVNIEGLSCTSVVIREIEIYKKGAVSDRYDHNVKLGYKKKIRIENGVFKYTPAYKNEDIDYIILEVF